VLGLHSNEFTLLPNRRIWFADAPMPARECFDSVQAAIRSDPLIFPNGATVEELRNVLCLSTIQGQPMTRLAIVQTLSTHPTLYAQIDRGRYALAESDVASQLQIIILKPGSSRPFFRVDDEDGPFDPASFFGGHFVFAVE
jgi:hypothetical protein